MHKCLKQEAFLTFIGKKPWSFRSDVTADWAVLGIHILFTARFPELRAVGMGLSLAELWEQE